MAAGVSREGTRVFDGADVTHRRGCLFVSSDGRLLTGWISDRWLAAGASGNRVRKTTILVAFGGLAVCLIVCARAGHLGSLLAMGGCGVFLGTELAGVYACAQTLGGPTAPARWMGVQNFCANIAGVTAPLITGVVIDRTGDFTAAFVIAAGVAVLGFLAFAFAVRRIEHIDWQTELDSSRTQQ